jgi:hypothetical protein
MAMKTTGSPLSEADLRAWEIQRRVFLPEAYRRFMLKFNGGRPEPASFNVPGWPGKRSLVGDFLQIRAEPYNLDEYIDEYRDRLPNELIPIAHDPGGNAICIAVSGEHRGTVYYWDSSNDWGLWEETGTIFLLSNDFDTFVESLSVV